MAKDKLRLSALFISVIIITVTLCYVIVSDKTPPLYYFVVLIVVVSLLAIYISRIRNVFIAGIFIKMLDFAMLNFVGGDTNTLEKRVDIQQIKNRKQDEYIKNRPILHFFVVAVIIITIGGFAVALFYQFLQLIK